jgi:uncharacterized membrane protein YedE/YeeE
MDTVTVIGTGLFGLGAVLWIVCAVMAHRDAPRRGRRARLWTVLAIIFGPIALFALYVLPRGRQRG